MYSIKDLENLSGIKAHTLRIWEQRYDFFSPERTETGIRRYSTKDFQKTLNTSLLLNRGGKISKIAVLTNDEINQAVLESKSKSGESNFEIDINELLVSILSYNENKFTEIFDLLNSKLGLGKTIHNVIFPLLQKIGLLWSANEIAPTNEHFASNLIKQKLFTEINKLPNSISNTKCVLFLPSSNFHEISLLNCHYLVKKKGIQSIFLGQDLPLESLLISLNQINPDFLITSIYNSTTLIEFENYLEKLSKQFKKQIYVGTSLVKENTNLKGCKNLKFINNFDFITSLK